MPVQNKLQKNAEGISGDDYIKKMEINVLVKRINIFLKT